MHTSFAYSYIDIEIYKMYYLIIHTSLSFLEGKIETWHLLRHLRRIIKEWRLD
jgi:hypothetical protein